jgi:pilus assembly protein CpaB
MKVAVITLVLLGLGASVFAVFLVAGLTGRSGNATTQPVGEQQVEVMLAARDLVAMTVVDSSAVITKKVPKSQVPQNALLNPVQVVGKVITDRMVAQQMFTKTCFAKEGSGVYLAAAVPPGKRAMSIQLNDWSSMAGLLYPGSVVDVLVSFKTLGVGGRRDETEAMSTTLLQGLQVVAIGSQSIADDEYKDKDPGAMASRGQMNFRMVTLLVDSKQAEILQLAMENGSISLAMRNPLDAAREARRLTRAREISPNRVAITSTPAADPFAAPPPSSDTQGDDAATGKAQDPNTWETVIIRGSNSEKRTFKIPEHSAADSADEDSTSNDSSSSSTGAGE